MPSQINAVSYPLLFTKYKATPNFLPILEIIAKEFYYLFDIDALEAACELNETHEAYFDLFNQIISQINPDLYTEAELLPILAQKVHSFLNNGSYAKNIYIVPDKQRPSLKQLGIYEKLVTGVLQADQTQATALKQFGFSVLDIARSAQAQAQAYQVKPSVCELNHLPYVSNTLDVSKPLFIRSRFGDPKELSQWIVTYYDNEDKKLHLYSESPLCEEDKEILFKFLKEKGMNDSQIKLEGFTDALSMSSGIRAVAKLVERFGGAGLAKDADYASLLIEWVWFISTIDLNFPSLTAKYTINTSYTPRFSWDYMRRHTLRFDTKNQTFSLLDLCSPQKLNENLTLNDHYQMRTYYLGLNWLLEHNALKILTVDPKSSIVSLAIPENIVLDPILGNDPILLEHNINVNNTNLRYLYSASGIGDKARYVFNSNFISKRTPNSPSTPETVAATFVLNVFRACAKLKKLQISLPKKWNLNEAEINLVCYLMESNPFVCELINPTQNISIATIHQSLQHIFARNRWLSINGYLPPLLDDFWGIAAEYWIAYLKQSPDLEQNQSEQREFKRCVTEMGKHGLKSVLNYLKQEEHTLKGEFNKLLQNKDTPPSFFGGCPASDISEYTTLLLNHLRQGAYFPFGRFMFSFVPGANRDLLNLLIELNQFESFEKISLIDCLSKDNKDAFSAFLDLALEQAFNDEHWTCPIRIKELDSPSNDPEIQKIRLKYLQMNNLLMSRMRKKHTTVLEKIQAFKEITSIDDHEEYTNDEAEEALTSTTGKRLTQNREGLIRKFSEQLEQLEHEQYPLMRLEGILLQMQQQQQIKQERSRVLENESEQGTAYADILPTVLVNYDNIDELLGEFYNEYKKEHGVDERKAILKKEDESILQGFFRTWINAEPNKGVEHIISKMTLDAAKTLLQFHRQLSAGLNTENLPKRFYTQHNATGELVLGFKQTLSYTTNHNPLTLKLHTDIPQAELCLGDFRQLYSNPHINHVDLNNEKTVNHIKLFSQLQPMSTKEAEAHYKEFVQKNLSSTALSKIQKEYINKNQTIICNHWHLFYELYEMKGSEGINLFMHLAVSSKLTVEDPLDLEILLSKVSEPLKTSGIDIFSYQPQPFKKALAQIYFQYGPYGLERFLNVLSIMRTRLGSNCTDSFIQDYLNHCQTFTPLLEESYLDTLDEMIRVLSQDNEAKTLWMAFLKLQMDTLEWEPLPTLWKGYYFFYQNLRNMELHTLFTPSLLAKLEPKGQNQLVLLDRILASLDKIPNHEQRKTFLSSLLEIDLTEGGVPYAVRHDGYTLIDRTLELDAFYKGTPSYTVDMKVLFSWPGDVEALFIKRALASKGCFSSADYQIYSTITDKSLLLWVLHVQAEDAQALLKEVHAIPKAIVDQLAAHFHRVFYLNNAPYARYSIEILKLALTQRTTFIDALNKYPNSLVVLDAMKALYTYNKLSPEAINAIFNYVQAAPQNHPHLVQGILFASIYGIPVTALKAFYELTNTHQLKGITHQELTVLMQQLFSLDLTNTEANLSHSEEILHTIMQGIRDMDANPLDITNYRKQLVKALKEKGLNFKSSIAGDYRFVNDEDLHKLSLDQTFELHAERLKKFFKNHITISESQKDTGPLVPLVEFFKRLQLNKTYINEVEPLLTSLENVLKDYPICWAAPYFNHLLHALQPKENNACFPVGLLEALLTEPYSPFYPTNIDELHIQFDAAWGNVFDAILSKSQTFTRDEQAQLARIAIRVNALSNDKTLILHFIERLSQSKFNHLRTSILNLLLSHPTEQCESNIDLIEQLVSLNSSDKFSDIWTKTCELWIDTLTEYPELKTLFIQDKINAISDAERKAKIIHIIAWSSFTSHHHITAAHENYLTNGAHSKTAKLIERLQDLSDSDLDRLSQCYPGRPMPDTRVLLTLIKETQEKEEMSFTEALDCFLKAPYSERRHDYKALSTARTLDLQRMLAETSVVRGETTEPLNEALSVRLSFIFQYLKCLETGTQMLEGYDIPIFEMSPTQLQEAFRACSEAPSTDRTQAEIWAILFEVLGRTTEKYPHLAQQFALIANDVMLTEDPSHILQLKTGEGKSHFIALRAAKLAGTGKKVDVLTAKWSLAVRDLSDYKAFFDYLDISTASLHARSSRDSYLNAQVIYSTPGDLSLFLDEQATQGQPVDISKEIRVALGDEFDFLYYEGQKTQFNYARHSGITPKEMTWFYRGINTFYDQFLQEAVNNRLQSKQQLWLSQHDMVRCFEFLTARANEDGLDYLDSLKNNPFVMLSWLQSAHEAASLKMDVHYTTRFEKVKIGEEEIPLQEIYPLTKDMQAAVGSTFSHGVHQLLAARLNEDARTKEQPQNYHVHPESDIVSSQVFSQRLKSLYSQWEGFTGTVSSGQAVELYQEYGTAVLRVPTNQKDLRLWLPPRFFKDKKHLYTQMVADIKHRLKENKSILLCCATDAEVNGMKAILKEHFSEEMFAQHFLVHTNQSHLTSAEVLRLKKEMEGDYLGQKQNGVVLLAAGFGRGDNVDVETVMLNSVHDINDLGQKGGRTARNGAEGEVCQYYLAKDIDEELLALMKHLDKPEHQATKEMIVDELQDKNHCLYTIIVSKGDRSFALKSIDNELKFKVMLALREFLFAQDNQLSLIYHEAKARLSSEAVRYIGRIDEPSTRDKCIRSFAYFLDMLNKEWISIPMKAHSHNERIDLLHQFIARQQPTLRRLFKLNDDFPFTPQTPKALRFVLEQPDRPSNRRQQLMSQLYGQWLKLSTVATIPELWHAIAHAIANMNNEQIIVLLEDCQHRSTIDLETFIARIQNISQASAVAEELEATHSERQVKLSTILHQLIPHRLSKKLSQLLIKLGPESELITEYLCNLELDEISNHIEKVIPILEYIAQDKFTGLGTYRESFFKDFEVRNSLMGLPSACFQNVAPAPASVFYITQQFLSKYITPSDESYVHLFKCFIEGTQYQIDQRIRLFTYYEKILARSHDQKQTLKHLAALSNGYRDKAYLAFVNTLLDKITALYATESNIDALDKILALLAARLPDILKATQVIEHFINHKKKEFIPCLTRILEQVNTNFLEQASSFFAEYWYVFPRDKKKSIENYFDMLSQVNHWYNSYRSEFEQHPWFLKQIFEIFNPFYHLTEFKASDDKGRALDIFYHLTKHLIQQDVDLEKVKQYFENLAKNPASLSLMWELMILEHPDYAPEIAFNGVLDLIQTDADPQSVKNVCTDFYNRRKTGAIALAAHPAFHAFDKDHTKERIQWMKMLKNGIFIPQADLAGITNWSEEENKALYEQGLAQYLNYAKEILKTSGNKLTSPQQHTALFSLMDELKAIAQVSSAEQPTNSPFISDELVASIRQRLMRYVLSPFKNSERQGQLQQIITTLQSGGCADHLSALQQLTAFKKQLIREDIQKASLQFIPHLHFWGTSRLYKTLNDIEDLVVKSWVEHNNDMLSNTAVIQHDMLKNQLTHEQHDYIEELKNALEVWTHSNQFSFFKNSAVKLSLLIANKSDQEIFHILNENKKLISSLPGTLKAIVNEALIHEVPITSAEQAEP